MNARPAPPPHGRRATSTRAPARLVERALFNHRVRRRRCCACWSPSLLGWQATQLQLNASFEKTIPTQPPVHRELPGAPERAERAGQRGAHRGRQPEGHDLRREVPRHAAQAQRRGLPAARRGAQPDEVAVDADHALGRRHRGGPGRRAGDPRRLRRLARRACSSWRPTSRARARSASSSRCDAKSSVIFVPLLAKDAEGQAARLRRASPQRSKRCAPSTRQQGVQIHITGFAKIVGDLIDGVRAVLVFFALAVAIAAAMVFWYTRCVRSTVLVVAGLADRGGLAARAAADAGLRARPVFDPGALPRLRHRHEPRRAEDERHHAGRRPRHATSWSPRATPSAACSWPA